MHELHRVTRREGELADQHLIEQHAERVEIATRVDRAIHAPCLFGRHVRERAGDDARRLGRLPFATCARRTPEAREPGGAARRLDQD
jgi:hypothetical protein